MKEEIFAVISAVMEIPLDDISEDTTKDNVPNWDSLRQLNLVFALEDNFGVKFSDEDILQMNGVRDILGALSRMTAEKVSSGS